MIGRKHLILQLTDHNIYIGMLLINLWEELQRLFRYRQYVSIFQASKGNSVGYRSHYEINTGILEEYFQNKSVDSWLLINFWRIFETIGKLLTGLQFVLRFLDSFLKKGVMLAQSKEDGKFEEFTASLNWIQVNSAK